MHETAVGQSLECGSDGQQQCTAATCCCRVLRLLREFCVVRCLDELHPQEGLSLRQHDVLMREAQGVLQSKYLRCI